MSNLKEIIDSCGDATIVAATKYVDTFVMEELLANGINNFGENRVDSFLEKYGKLASNNEIVWHFIGTLQTNKVKKMINKISYLHSLNSVKLASCIDKYRETPLNCFLEVNLTESLSKTGINPDNIISSLAMIKEFKNVNVIGLMTMTEADMTDLEKMEVFTKLKNLKEELNKLGYSNITHLSMGMSDDYHIAITCGATFVRLGRILFS
jgi:pyridoxal phosphate enzyme (YggS family)